MLTDIALVAAGGAIGGVARFQVAALVLRRFGGIFPWGTLAVNVSGALCLGAAAGWLQSGEAGAMPHGPVWSLLAIGALGSYTTVSSFSLQTLALVDAGRPGLAVANIAASLGLCLGAAAVGFAGVLALGGAL